MDAALGCRANVFMANRSNQTAPCVSRSINIHHQAAPLVCRHMLEAMIALAKSFPHHFFPLAFQPKDESQNDDSMSGLIPEFWDVLARLDSTSSTSGRKGKVASKSSNTTTTSLTGPSPQTTNSSSEITSPLAHLMGFLSHPVIKRSFSLTDRLLHLLSEISTAFPMSSSGPSDATHNNRVPPRSNDPDFVHRIREYARGRRRPTDLPASRSSMHMIGDANSSSSTQQPNVPPSSTATDTTSNSQDKSSSDALASSGPRPVLIGKQYLKLAVDVLTSKSCSEEGLDDVTSLLTRLSRTCDTTRSNVLALLMEGARELGMTVCSHILSLKQELKDYNRKTYGKPANTNTDPTCSSNMDTSSTQASASSQSTDASTGNPSVSQKGLVHDRFTNESVIITAPTGTKSGREVQLPSMALLTSKNSSQAFFLRILRVIIQLRDLKPNNTHLAQPAIAPSEQAIPSASTSGGSHETPVSATVSMDVDSQNDKTSEENLSTELKLENLWDTLSSCLLELAETPDHHAVLVLQPAVEAFFLVHSPNSTRRSGQGLDDLYNDQTAHIDQEIAPVSPGDAATQASGDSHGVAPCNLPQDTEKFLKFAETHRVVLNHILRQSTTPLSDGPFSVLVDHTRVLDFDVKRRYFRQELERMDDGVRREDLGIHVRRDNVFEESFRELHRRSAEEWKNRFFVVFEDEEGQDAGGLLREWYTIISREIFNPMYALFCTSPGDRVTYMINSSSHCNTNHLTYFKFVGRVIAKAIYDNKLLDCYFTRSFYKHILGKLVKYTDMESEDYSFYQGLVFLLEHDVKELGYELTFSLEVREFGVTEVRELKPNGSNIPVTEENKHEYVRLVCQEKMTGSIRKQLNAFLEGFYEIIPKRLISIFNEQELELLISGLPNIDIDDLKASTEYHKYLPNSLQIQWFWRALRSFDQADRAKLLQFVTGTSKVPLQGFASLEGMNGVQKFQIHRDERSTDRLPSAHTW